MEALHDQLAKVKINTTQLSQLGTSQLQGQPPRNKDIRSQHITAKYNYVGQSARQIGQLFLVLSHLFTHWRWKQWLHGPRSRGQSSPGYFILKCMRSATRKRRELGNGKEADENRWGSKYEWHKHQKKRRLNMQNMVSLHSGWCDRIKSIEQIALRLGIKLRSIKQRIYHLYRSILSPSHFAMSTYDVGTTSNPASAITIAPIWICHNIS